MGASRTGGGESQVRDHWDVAIAGGGIMGCSTAYFLASSGDFDGSVVVVERDPTYQTGAATRSLGGIRQQFSTPENVQMSMFGAVFAREAAERLDVEGDPCEVSFREQGYLTLADEAGVEGLRRNWEIQCGLGAALTLLGPDALKERFGWLNTDGLGGGVFGHANEGWIDPHALLMGFRRKARSLGVTFLDGEVTRIDREGDRVTGFRTTGHGAIRAGATVLAAGSRAGGLAGSAGLFLPVVPRKRHVYVFDCRDRVEDAPLVIDPGGVAFRPEGDQYLGTVSPPEDRDPDSDALDFEIEYEDWEGTVWPALAHRVPAFEAVKLTSAWAGHYDFNTFDHNAIIGPDPDVSGLLYCNGFSGHGMQQSAAAGRAVSELVAYGGFRSIDLKRFGIERVRENRPLVESAVI